MGFFNKLKHGLKKSSEKLSKGVTEIFTHKKLDEEILEDLEDLLLTADLGVETTQFLIERMRKEKFGKEISPEEVKEFLAEEIATLLHPYAKSLCPEDFKGQPSLILMAGVNGSGKTTTSAKLSKKWQDQGIKVGLVAADTFRAAAIEQLEVWSELFSIPFFSKETGADAAGLVFDALTESRAQGFDVLIVDTAGRLHTNSNLMAELEKIVRASQKVDPKSPHEAILVIDATIGQNAFRQVEVFQKSLPLSGLIITKLDGSAKGGIVVGLAKQFKLPIYAVGVGESIEDLSSFDPKEFSKSLLS